MIFDPSPGGRAKKIAVTAVARPIHVSNSHNKFGWILSGDSITDRRMDGAIYDIPFTFLKKFGDKNSDWFNLHLTIEKAFRF